MKLERCLIDGVCSTLPIKVVVQVLKTERLEENSVTIGVKKVISCQVLGEDVSCEADTILATFPGLVYVEQFPCSSRCEDQLNWTGTPCVNVDPKEENVDLKSSLPT